MEKIDDVTGEDGRKLLLRMVSASLKGREGGRERERTV